VRRKRGTAVVPAEGAAERVSMGTAIELWTAGKCQY
jgi:hypothetical protein